MKYKNANKILPKELVNEIQKYIQGDLIYIPTSREKLSWGEKNGTKQAIYNRNKEIFIKYSNGLKVKEIQEIFNLSESSIRKIISKFKVNNCTSACLGGSENE